MISPRIHALLLAVLLMPWPKAAEGSPSVSGAGRWVNSLCSEFALAERPTSSKNPIGSPEPRVEMIKDASDEDAEAAFMKELQSALEYPYGFTNKSDASVRLQAKFRALKNRETAVTHLRRAIKKNPNADVFWELLLADADFNGDDESALQIARAWRKAKPGWAGVQVEVARRYLHLENYQEAARSAQSAVGMERKNPLAHAVLGAAYVRLQQPEDAIPSLLKAIDLHPTFLDARNDLAVAYWQKKDWSKMLEVARSTMKLPKVSGKSYDMIAKALWKNGFINQALTEIQNGIAKFPDHSALYITQAFILSGRGDLSAALKALEHALNVDPGNARAADLLAKLRDAQGKGGTGLHAFPLTAA